MRTMLPIAIGAALLAGCGHKPPVLTQQAFDDAARACHAQGARFTPAAVKGDAPDLHVIDSVVTLNGQRVNASRCVAARLQGYSYGHMVLDAPASATAR